VHVGEDRVSAVQLRRQGSRLGRAALDEALPAVCTFDHARRADAAGHHRLGPGRTSPGDL
jgi:hypothetical protein